MNHWLRSSLLMILMLAASAGAVALRPSHKIADQGPKVDLQAMIPTRFGDWREEQLTSAQIIDPQQLATIEKIYSQTLSRTYVNAAGYRIMLSIAYGSDQTDAMQVHKPEICYPAQGFVLENKQTGSLETKEGAIPVTRILTTLGQRVEPVTYWTTVADHVVRNGANKKFIELSYGLTGKIPDGMLFRVSSIDPEARRAYAMQDEFAAQLLESLPPDSRRRIAGNLQLN